MKLAEEGTDYANYSYRLARCAGLLYCLFQVLAKDANINVCALAAKCVTGLANGLRSKFAQFVTLVI